MRSLRFWFALMLVCSAPAIAEDRVASPETVRVRDIDVQKDGRHPVGQPGNRGWAVDYSKHRPGYVFDQLKDPMILDAGLYRTTFTLRRGHYPRKGFLYKAYGMFRVEMWDATAAECLVARELQIGDFPSPDRYETNWIEFSARGREGHRFEPRVYWIGLANGEVARIDVDRLPVVDAKILAEKSEQLSLEMLKQNFENGFVVCRNTDGMADETGDATTYTGFYVASLAWKYAATKNELTYQALENGVVTLRKAILGTDEEPLLSRYIDAAGQGFPKSPSKDVYASFFLAYAAAYPLITNEPLKALMRSDLNRITTKFLKDDLCIKAGDQTLVSLTPYLTREEILSGVQKLLSDKKKSKKFVKALKTSRRLLPFGELWPGMKLVIGALEKQDENKLMALILPTMNGAFILIERARDILREQYRMDLFPRRYTNPEYPGIKLADALGVVLKRFPKNNDGQRLRRYSDLKILASNALISLHMVKTAAVITKNPAFDEYYKTNLFTQDALLKTAVDWHGWEDDLACMTAGNAVANEERRGYLGTLALMNLLTLEKNPSVHANYQKILEKEWDLYRNDDNPMMAAFSAAFNGKPTAKDESLDFLLRGLELYPANRQGLGRDYWEDKGKSIAEKFGAGEHNEYSREPLPVSERPRDSFLWQRNARRLKGDYVKIYPSTDYLFAYWFARANGLIEAPPPNAVAEKKP